MSNILLFYFKPNCLISFDGLVFQEITKFLISNLVIGCDHSLISQRIHLTCKLVRKHFAECLMNACACLNLNQFILEKIRIKINVKLGSSLLLNTQNRSDNFWESLWNANTWKHRVVRVLRSMIAWYNTSSRAWLLNRILFQHFNIISAWRFTVLRPTDNLKLSNDKGEGEGICTQAINLRLQKGFALLTLPVNNNPHLCNLHYLLYSRIYSNIIRSLQATPEH